jgi:hypothetical protein
MRSRFLLNIFLFLIVIGLALFLARTTNDVNDQDIVLTSLDPNSINKIKIIRRDLEEISFSKQGDQWMVKTPYEIAANNLRINSILKLLQAHSYTQLDSNDVELNRFLLEDPVVSIQFDDTKIDFGDTSPIGKDKLRYVLLNNIVHLVNDSLYQQLLTNASFFISPKLIPEGSNIKALYLLEHNIQLVDGIWKVDPNMDIGANDIIAVVNAWRNAEAITVRKFISGDIKEKITIELDQTQAIEFTVVSPLPNLILARPEFNVQYHISSYDADQLFPAENKNTATDNKTITPEDTPGLF